MSQEVVTSDANVAVRTQYDLIMTTNLDGGLSNLLMKPTETYFFEAYIISTNPVTNLEFEIGTLFGDVDALHFGIPVVNFGSAFRFTKSWPKFTGEPVKENSVLGDRCVSCKRICSSSPPGKTARP